MREKLILVSFVLLIPLIGFSQPSNFYNVDYGLKLGGSNYIGDLGGYNQSQRPFVFDMKMQETRWAIGAYGRYRLGVPESNRNNPWSIEVQLNWIRIEGADSLTKNYNPRKLRNLCFRNDIFQFNMMGEWNFFEDPDIGDEKDFQKGISAYMCSGLSILYQDPYAYNPYHYLGLPTWVNLHGLRTEAQLYNKPFHYIQPGIPLGAGVNYTIGQKIRLGWSITWTETFTDYLDGVSGEYPSQAQWNTLTPEEKYFSNRIESLAGIDPAPNGLRGNSKGHDSFMTSTLNVGYVLQYHHIRHHKKDVIWKHTRSKF